ncbi:MAG: glycosyltransferase family 4 protein, partial [Terriglobales bacterium]
YSLMANLPRIAHADFSPVWRGGQQQLLLLIRQLREFGCEQMVIARPGVVMQRLQAAEVEVAAPGLRARRWASSADVMHAHDGHAHTWALQAAWRHRGLRVLSRRVAFPIRGWGSRWKYRRLDLAIAVSECVRREVSATGLAPARIAVIPDAVDFAELPDPAAARDRVRARCNAPAGAILLVCVGALTPEKGVGDLIAALSRLPASCRVVLPGEGPLRGTLQRRALALDVSERVHFVDQSEFSPADWVAAADVLVMPSRQEGLGSAALLAMSLGRPVVATAVGGIPELIEPEVTGLLVPVGDIEALAGACRRLVDEPGLGERLATAASMRVRQRHAIAQIAAATLAAYSAASHGGGG